MYCAGQLSNSHSFGASLSSMLHWAGEIHLSDTESFIPNGAYTIQDYYWSGIMCNILRKVEFLSEK